MIKRVYYLNGEIATLEDVLYYLEQRLELDGNTSVWADLGVDFEDMEVNV